MYRLSRSEINGLKQAAASSNLPPVRVPMYSTYMEEAGPYIINTYGPAPHSSLALVWYSP